MQPELHIQKFLRNIPNGKEALLERYVINSKRHNEFPQLYSFKYNQIDSPFSEPMVQEARGIVLDESDNWNVVAMGFKKFFNYGESNASVLDWTKTEVQEKVDGSLILLYWYSGKWNVATSGTPDASGEVNGFGKTFAELFWETAKAQDLKVEWLGKEFTWIFELATPFNRVVVDHKDCKIWGLSSRHIPSLVECQPGLDFGKTCNVYMPARYPLHSIEDCVKAAETLNPCKHEGYVANQGENRIKIKSPAYIMLHHAKDSLSKRRMCEIIRKGECEEFKTAIDSLPELKKIFDEIYIAHETVRMVCEIYYEKCKALENQKEFALRIKDFDNGHQSCILFQMRKTGQSAAQCLASPKLSLDAYMNLIGVK